MTVRSLIVDFGGVLMRTADPAPRRELERRYGLRPGGVDCLVFGNALWEDAQLGHVSSGEFWARMGQQLGLDADGLAEFQELFWAGDRLDKDLVALMRRLHDNGYRTALLSNNPAALHQRVGHLFADVFDVIVVSGCEGVMKPDPTIFGLTLARLGIPAGEAVFVDDSLGNVAAARQVGLQAVHFRGLAPLRHSLRGLGVAIPVPVLELLPDVHAVIFDWGGVLERSPDRAHLSTWERRLDLEPGTLSGVLWGEMGRELEIGAITFDEFGQYVAERLGFPSAEAGNRFIEAFYTCDWLNCEMVAAARALRGRYRVGLLSNAFTGQDQWIERLYGLDLHDEFDVYVNSARAGLRKADPAVFHLALDRLQVDPHQAIFLDDNLRNVDAARDLGIHTIQFVEPATALADLETLLGHPIQMPDQ